MCEFIPHAVPQSDPLYQYPGFLDEPPLEEDESEESVEDDA